MEEHLVPLTFRDSRARIATFMTNPEESLLILELVGESKVA